MAEMLPPHAMFATKKPSSFRGRFLVIWGIALLLAAGCTPPGPRALLRGEKLIEQAKYSEAIGQLKVATELLPQEARAWNYLGLAYHRSGQVTNAVIAYRRALALDRDLMTVHFNLGCLWLEQGLPNAAIEELNSYVTHPRYAKDVQGWTQLGRAFLQAKRWDDAEKVFTYPMQKLGARSPELFNNLGIIQVQRRQFSSAANYFNAALAQQSNYGPALLNLATVYHQQANSRPLALRKYREYLALTPRPENWAAVAQIAKQLDRQLHPPKPGPVASNLVARAAAPTNAPAAPQANLRPPAPQAKQTVSAPKPAPVKPAPLPAPAPKTTVANAHPTAGKTTPAVKPPRPERPAPSIAKSAVPKKTPDAPRVARAKAKPVPPKPRPAPSPAGADELAIRPAPNAAPIPSGPVTRQTLPPVVRPSAQDPALANIGKPPPPQPKQKLWTKLNPFRRGAQRHSRAATTPLTNPPVAAQATPAAARPVTRSTRPVRRAPRREAVKAVPRYAYRSPAKPLPGNRAAAKRYFDEGLRMQRNGERTQALGFYRRATELDPAYFEAYYNLALVTYAQRDWPRALEFGELALALRPESIAARHQFALALRQAGYYFDALRELQKILESNPDEVPAHLALANLYAQQLDQPQRAREHYLAVLAQAPRNPQAAQIRAWLAAHP